MDAVARRHPIATYFTFVYLIAVYAAALWGVVAIIVTFAGTGLAHAPGGIAARRAAT